MIGSIFLFYYAKYIANNVLLIPECENSLIALAPSIFFVSIASCIRGFFNGINQIPKTAKSQTIEQILKSVLTIGMVEICSYYYDDTAFLASIASLTTSISIFFSLIYLLKTYRTLRKVYSLKIMEHNKIKNESVFFILKKILEVSIPITFTAVLGTLGKNIDSLTVVRILTPILGDSAAKLRYGILSSKVEMLTVMPLAFNIAFSTALVPKISADLAVKDFSTINKRIYFSMLVTLIIAFPAAIGLSFFSQPILNLLFPNASDGAELLKISALSVIILAMIQTINGVLSGIGKANVSAISLLVGIVVKIILNTILIPNSYFYEKGAIIGSIGSNLVVLMISWNILAKNIPLEFRLDQIVMKPFCAAMIMGVSSYEIYLYMFNYGMPEKIATIFGIVFAIFIYLILLLLLKVFSKEEILLLPKGEETYRFLKKLKIY